MAYQIHPNGIIEFHPSFNEPLDAYIPLLSQYKTVALGASFNQPLNILPPSVEFLIWSNSRYTGNGYGIREIAPSVKKIYYKCISTSTDEWMDMVNLLIDCNRDMEMFPKDTEIATFIPAILPPQPEYRFGNGMTYEFL